MEAAWERVSLEYNGPTGPVWPGPRSRCHRAARGVARDRAASERSTVAPVLPRVPPHASPALAPPPPATPSAPPAALPVTTTTSPPYLPPAPAGAGRGSAPSAPSLPRRVHRPWLTLVESPTQCGRTGIGPRSFNNTHTS